MESPEIAVSVLMLTYNQRDYVAQAIESVLAQNTSYAYEIVIADDCSTDGTADVCTQYAAKHPNIRLLHRPRNLGLIGNFIDAYAHCRGRFVAICEGDDYWCSPHKIQRQASFLTTHSEYRIACHRVINYYPGQGTWSLSNGGQKLTEGTFADLTRSNFITNVSAMFRRIPADELPAWFDQVPTYDYPLHLLNAALGPVHYDRRPMAVYRQHNKAIWSQAQGDKKLLIAQRARQLVIDHFAAQPHFAYSLDDLRRSHAAVCVALVRLYQANGETEKAESALQALRQYSPNISDAEVQRLLSAPAPRRGLMSRVMTAGRKMVTRLVPIRVAERILQ